MKPHVLARRIKRLALTGAFLTLTTPFFGEERPWGLFRTTTAWEGQALTSTGLDVLQLGAAGLFSLRDLPLPGIAYALEAGYRWTEEGGAVTPDPFVLARVGWHAHLVGPLAMQPFLEAGWQFAEATGATAGAGITLMTRVSDEDYLAIEPRIEVPILAPTDLRFGVGVGIRRDSAWLLAVKPVRPSLAVSPVLFSPDGDGNDDEVTVLVRGDAPKSATTWTITVTDSTGATFRTYQGGGMPPNPFIWDGLAADGSLPVPGETYRIALRVRDRAGRKTDLEGRVTCDILIVKDGDRYKVRVPAIRFPKNSFTLAASESKELYEANREVLNRIAEMFLRFPDYSLIVEGHANPVWWNDPARFKKEQETELIPLSEKRAKAVRQALMLAGIEESRIGIEAKGGLEPLSTDQDPESVAKNRRVEFILVRKQAGSGSIKP